MAVFPALLLLLAALAGSTLADTKFVFTGEVTCKNNWHRKFNYRILVYEDDICNDDLLSGGHSPSHLQVMSPHFYNITVTIPDDGAFDQNYEIVFMVVHDCLTDVDLGEKNHNLKARFEVGTYGISHGTHVVKKNMDVTNAGVPWNKVIRKSSKAAFCMPGCNCEADE